MGSSLNAIVAAMALLCASQPARAGLCDTVRLLAGMAPSGFASIEESGYGSDEGVPATLSLDGADECSVDGHEDYACLWASVRDPASQAERLGRQIQACLPGASLHAMDLLGMHVIDSDEARISVVAGIEDGVVLVTVQKSPASATASPAPASGPPAREDDGTIDFGETIRGRIERSDPALADESHYDEYRFSGRAGDHILVTMQSKDFSPFLTLQRMVDGKSEYVEDETPRYDDERIDRTLPATGEFIVRAGTLASGVTGDYTVTLER